MQWIDQCSINCDFMVYVLNSLICKFCWHKINFYSGMMELLLPSHFGNGWWNSSLTWSSLDWSREQELTDKLTIFWQSSVSGLERLWYQHSISWPVLSLKGTCRQLDWLKLFGWHSLTVGILIRNELKQRAWKPNKQSYQYAFFASGISYTYIHIIKGIWNISTFQQFQNFLLSCIV